MDAKHIKDRILRASDDEPNVHAIYKTGESEGIEYYLVIAEKTYRGRETLKIRFFAANKNNWDEDTWMKNGLTMRSSDRFIEKLAAELDRVAAGDFDHEDKTVLRNITDILPED